MEFDDFFDQDDNKRKRHHKYENDKSRYRDDYQKERQHSNSGIPLLILDKLRNNPKLRMQAIIGVVILLVIIIVLAIAILPLLFKMFGFAVDNGAKGVLDAVINGI